MRIGKYVNLAGKILGTVVVAGPGINAVYTAAMGNDLQDVGHNLLYAYTGYNDGNIKTGPGTGGAAGFNAAQAGVAAASVVGGIVVIKLFSWLGKRM